MCEALKVPSVENKEGIIRGQTHRSLMRKRMVDGGFTALYTVRWDSNVFKKACTDWLAALMQISMGKYMIVMGGEHYP